jgi:hypothetical protein
MSNMQKPPSMVMDPDPRTSTPLFWLLDDDEFCSASSSADPRLLEEFRLAEAARGLFADLHWPIEPWIALRLARMEGDFLRRELERLTRLQQAGRINFLGGLVADSLDRIKLAMSRHARELRAALVASGVPLGPDRLELVLAVLIRDEAYTPLKGEILRRAAEVDLYLTAPARGASAKAEELPRGVDRELLENLRRAEIFLGALAPVRPKVELWEAFSLAVRDRHAAKPASERMRTPDAEGVRLYPALVKVRLEKALSAHALRQYVAGLEIGKYSSDTMELSFAFILASPEGCRRVRQWLESPGEFKREAAIRVEGVIGLAQKYLHALRATA